MFVRRLTVIRIVRLLAIAAALLIAALRPAAGQSLRIPSGAYLPVGGADLTDAHLNAVQLAWTLRPQLAVVGTFAWAASRPARLAGNDAPSVDILNADLGVERQLMARCTACRVGLTTFAGLGAGARSYDQRGPGHDAARALTGYVAAGGEVRVGRVGLRLEARDYVGGAVGGLRARNDVVVMAGLRYIRRGR